MTATPRKSVTLFSRAMETKLQVHDHHRSWDGEEFNRLLERLQWEVIELARAVGNDDVRDECVDIANFAMMIWDNAGGAT